MLEQRTPTIYNECETEVAVFVCCGCSSKSSLLSGVYVYVGVFSADAKIWFVGMPVLCGNSFPRLKTRYFINFAARRDWCLHRDEACYCPVSGMPSGWGDGESVGHLCRCFSGRGGVCGTNERFFTGFQKPQVSPACLEKFHLLLFGLNCKGPVLKQIVGWIQNSNHLCWLWQKTFVNTSLFAA